jgi:predicted transcriptional regulator
MMHVAQSNVQAKPRPSGNITREVVRAVLKKFFIDAEEFFGNSRELHLIAARRDAALQLRSRGYSIAHIGRILGRHSTTVSNYVCDSTRKSKRLRYAANRDRMVEINPQYLAGLRKLAALSDTTIKAIVNQAVSDTLESS